MTTPEFKNIDVLKTSFKKVSHHGDLFIEEFYGKFFEFYPSVEPLFHTPMKEMHNKFLFALISVIDNLENPAQVKAEIEALGERHRDKYGVIAEHYPHMKKAFLATFHEFLGDDWTPEIEAAWDGAFTTIAEMMLNHS